MLVTTGRSISRRDRQYPSPIGVGAAVVGAGVGAFVGFGVGESVGAGVGLGVEAGVKAGVARVQISTVVGVGREGGEGRGQNTQHAQTLNASNHKYQITYMR